MLDEKVIASYIGKPFQKGGRGPEGFDCYGLVRELFLRDGIYVPDYASPEGLGEIAAAIASGVQTWRKVEPGVGRMVVFALPRTMHVGYTLTNGRMIHCWRWSNGVCIEPLANWQHRIVGFYEYVRD